MFKCMHHLLKSTAAEHRRSVFTLAAAKIPLSSRGKDQKSKRRKPATSQGFPPKTKNRSTSRQRKRSPPPNTIPNAQTRPPKEIKQQPLLPEPSIIFSNNHILLVKKPAGYHSQPNESIGQTFSEKCLLSKLKARKLGGGSDKNFLLPMHRLDQPCTGILLLAKTSKAGTRTGSAFRKHDVQKDYFCVVEGNLDEMMRRSECVQKDSGATMYKLSGVMMPSKSKGRTQQSKVGKSVLFKALDDVKNIGDKRVCYLEWQHLKNVSGSSSVGIHLVRVVTGTGAKHQIRAMLSQLAKSPVCGDLRYGASDPLPDRSVALHARSLFLPTVSLGDADSMKKLRFVAPIPKTWNQFFSLKEGMIPKINYNVK